MLPVADQLRALKDEDYRLTLDPAKRPHPAGDLASELYVTAAVQLNTCEYPSSCWRMCSM
ncbi:MULTISPECIES: hypothetical protein [unclassified Kitasatospora]|uniref:hypothetical protein n=1 Tax=unclassified Kitasatospora TaxID=2633591 RepID=UPI0033D64A7D